MGFAKTPCYTMKNSKNKKIGINIVIEKEKQDSDIIFVASSLDINVFAEGKDIDEVKSKFIEGVKHHFETFPEKIVKD